MDELEEGIMRVIAGPEKKTRVMSEKERLVTAYHEMGHAIVGHVLPNCDPVHKVSIIGRGQALGYTISLPGEDKFLTTRAELADTMAMTLGGRAAEEIIFSEITTGASNDLEKVTETAKGMVMRFGMSERLGPRVFGHDRSQPFLGREFSAEPDYSDEIAREIDDEIRRIVEEAHQTAKDILAERRTELERISKILLERETIDAEQFVKLLEGATEEDVFGAEDEEPESPEPAPEPERSAGREGPRPVPQPRPGFAGGSAEMRADEPRLPQLAVTAPAASPARARTRGLAALRDTRGVSAEQIAIMRDAFAAFARGDEDALLSRLSDDFEVHDSMVVEDTTRERGPGAMRRNLERIAEAFERVDYEPVEFLDLDGKILVRVRVRARGASSELDVETEVGQLWTMRGLQATRLEVFASWAEARRLQGLET